MERPVAACGWPTSRGHLVTSYGSTCGFWMEEVEMAERKERRKGERRQRKRRRYLDEGEFRKVVETGKVYPGDKRSWEERRKVDRRKKK